MRIPITSESQLSALECSPAGEFEFDYRWVYENDASRLASKLRDRARIAEDWALVFERNKDPRAKAYRAEARSWWTLYDKAARINELPD